MQARILFALTGAVVSASALAADVPLSVLNGGPSSDSIPTAADSPVAFIVAPREIVDPSIPTHLPIEELTDSSLLVQDAASPTSSGVRNRGRAVMAAFDVNNGNPPYLQVQANLGYDPTIADSYFVFLNAHDAANINTMVELESFVANGTAGTDYVQIFLNNAGFTIGSGAGGDYTDADIAEINLNVGALAFRVGDFVNITPDGGGSPGSAIAFEVALLVFSDGDGPGAEIPTEYFCMRIQPTRVAPVSATLSEGDVMLSIVADLPLATDGARTLVDYDTDPTVLTADSFRVRIDGVGASQTLGEFLANLSSPREAIGFGISGDRREILDIVFEAPIDPADAQTVLNATIGFAAEVANGRVYSFAGEDANWTVSTSYVPINRPPCPGVGNDADTNDDLVIDFTDLNAVLSVFGQTGMNLPGDTNGDGLINFTDLNAVLSSYGSNCF